MVFYCPTVTMDTRLFAVQVCLVENSDELMKVEKCRSLLSTLCAETNVPRVPL